LRYCSILDCSADPDQAIANWRSTLIGNEARFWDPPSWDVVHADDPYPENFAYRLNDVTFVGINLVAGTVHDEGEQAMLQVRFDRKLGYSNPCVLVNAIFQMNGKSAS